MNLSMFQRVVDRHRHMQEYAPYHEFLQHVVRQPDLWRATQADVARWWERRERAVLTIEASAPGEILVGCALEEASLVVDGGDPRELPARLPLDGEISSVRLRLPARHHELAAAMLRHLGRGHVQIEEGEESATATFVAAVDEYVGHGVKAARAYPVPALEALTEACREAHRRAGLPDLRLWTLPRGADGRPHRVAFSPRFDVDKAMVNVPMISQLHAQYDVHGTFYIRPMGCFYGEPEIRRWSVGVIDDELALHGEFVTTAEQRFGDEWNAAVGEKAVLERMLERPVVGVCTHGGELRTNQTANTPSATDRAGFLYESTFYERPYYLPMYLPSPEGIRPTLTMLRHQDDVSLPLDEGFGRSMVATFTAQLDEARSMGGMFQPTMHPLYFDLKNYLRQTTSWVRLAAFTPTFVMRAARMKRGQLWANQDAMTG